MRPRKLSLTFTAFFLVASLSASSANAQTETILHTFTDSKNDGGYPRAGLTVDQAGNLYGTTSEGGDSGGGTVYELKSDGTGDWVFSLLYSFPYRPYSPDDISPVSFDTAGNLYGTTPVGGSFNNGQDGMVFELTPQVGGGWSEKLVHDFDYNGKDGVRPNGVIVDSVGNLYGTTTYGGTGGCYVGCGTIFELARKNQNWVEEILYNFQYNSVDGYNPYLGLTRDTYGNLYGTTEYGGDYNQGTVFELSPSANGAWTYALLHSFGGSGDQGYPSSLIFSRGNLYGSTANGGNGEGNVYELSPASGGAWTEQILYNFYANFGGSGPELPVGIVIDSAGNIYGFAGSGGSNLDGAVFELTPQSGGVWSETTLYNFNYSGSGNVDGASPIGNPVLDSQGNLYGATVYGGAEDAGTVFKITP